MHGRRLSSLALALAAAALLVSSPAKAAVRLGLGADYWVGYGGLFNLTLGVDTRLARNILIGGRFGALATTDPVFGVPLDFEFRVDLGRIYLNALVGPWIMFGDSRILAHAAIGFGLESGPISFGLEVGYLTPTPMAGLRLAFRI